MRVAWSSIAAVVPLFVGVAAAAAQGGQSGSIRVLSNVERAIVSLDGVDVGVAPLEIKQVRAGEHVVAVRLEGHGRREDRVTVEPGSTAVVTLDLDGGDGGRPLPKDGDAGGEPVAPGDDGPGQGTAEGAGPPGPATPAPPPPAEVAAAPPSAEALRLERRGLTTFGAQAMPRGHTTVAIGAGYPYLIDSRILVGAAPRDAPFALDAGVLFRTYGARWELGLVARATIIDQEPFALGAFADAGGGSTYFDDSKRNNWFLSGGLAASLTGLGAVTITGRAYLSAWTDRHCPGEVGEGKPTQLCLDYRNDALTPDERARVDDLVGAGNLFDRDSGVRAMLSLAVELALSDQWSGWLLVEGAPRQDERAAFTDEFHSAMFEEDARSYARVGLTYKF
jgi:hypothetical protein